MKRKRTATLAGVVAVAFGACAAPRCSRTDQARYNKVAAPVPDHVQERMSPANGSSSQGSSDQPRGSGANR